MRLGSYLLSAYCVPGTVLGTGDGLEEGPGALSGTDGLIGSTAHLWKHRDLTVRWVNECIKVWMNQTRQWTQERQGRRRESRVRSGGSHRKAGSSKVRCGQERRDGGREGWRMSTSEREHGCQRAFVFPLLPNSSQCPAETRERRKKGCKVAIFGAERPWCLPAGLLVQGVERRMADVGLGRSVLRLRHEQEWEVCVPARAGGTGRLPPSGLCLIPTQTPPPPWGWALLLF